MTATDKTLLSQSKYPSIADRSRRRLADAWPLAPTSLARTAPAEALK